MISCVIGILATPAVKAESVTELLEKLEVKRKQVRSLYLESSMTVTQYSTQKQPTTLSHETKQWERCADEKCKSRSESKSTTVHVAGANKQIIETETLTVSDGATEWSQHKHGDKTTVMKRKPAPDTTFEEIRTALEEGGIARLPDETLLGHSCVVLDVDHYLTSTKIKYWITEEHGIPLRAVSDHGLLRNMEMIVKAVKVNEPIDDALFSYKPPEGASIMEMPAREDMDIPTDASAP